MTDPERQSKQDDTLPILHGRLGESSTRSAAVAAQPPAANPSPPGEYAKPAVDSDPSASNAEGDQIAPAGGVATLGSSPQTKVPSTIPITPDPHRREDKWTGGHIALFAVELASIAVVTMIGALVFLSFFDKRLPPVVFGPVAYSETFPAPLPPRPPEPPPAVVNSTYSVFFENGSSTLSYETKRFLESLAAGLGDCQGVQVSVIGSTSSVAYRGDPKDDRNTDLGIKRAEHVASYLHGVNSSLSPEVKKMHLKRRYYDARLSPNKPRPAEQLNRRVDLVLNEADCQTLAATAAGSPTK